ncbi:GFA family protein [Parvibaculum sp.]|uniref:GFA family protein n=1 Tax=Parvibaculum sp. TaxID=2024848 RepID=UPI002BC41BFA|nr:GFA family protein [Parvibaculum sp.]HUD51841.1 GFA family protein [Parvibaculum sp.]
MTESRRRLTGRCMCGAVQYSVTDEFLYAVNCHCSKCRQATGAAFKPFAGIEREKLTVETGETGFLIVGDERDNHDLRCATCGSLLYSVVRDGRFVHVTLGTLLDDPSIRPTAHIFVGSKAPWFAITDDLPRYDGHVISGG